MRRKLRVAILFGGKSAEHEVSVISARNVAAAMDPRTYEVVLVGIDKAGRWLPSERSRRLLNSGTVASAGRKGRGIALIPESNGTLEENGERGKKIDVVFPILHGPFGEDGTVQGLLRLANVPFVGAGVAGSAIGMDKDVMKRLLRDAGIPIGKFLTFEHDAPIAFARVKKELGLPLFVKPANLGSSVGISKVRTEKEFREALRDAFRFDTKVIIEEFIKGREIECAVLGNEKPIASIPGEVVVHHDFYSYDAKYLDETGASLVIPAKLPAKTKRLVQQLAVRTFKALCCEGMGRVDCFVTDSGRVVVNEINTIPGFTNISMYPKLWEASGLPYAKLVDTLIELAIERFKKQQKLKTNR